MKLFTSLRIRSFLLIFFSICATQVFAQAVGDYRSNSATMNWSQRNRWERWDGTAWTAPTMAQGTPTNASGVITIRNGHTVTVTASVIIDQCTIDAGGQVTVNAGQILTVANGALTDLTVNGALVNSNNVTTTGTVVFNANSVYQHARNGGVIPTATWAITSNCNITGVTDTAPTGLNPVSGFGNFTWNCTGQTALVYFIEALTTVNGNFTVDNTHNGATIYGIFLAETNGSIYTLNVGGDLIINVAQLFMVYGQGNNAFGDNVTATVNVGGNFSMSGGNSYFHYWPVIATGAGLSLNKLSLNVTGNYSQAGGIFNFCAGSSDTPNYTELNLTGNLSFTGGVMESSTLDPDITNGRITFNNSGNQTVSATTPTNLAYTNFVVASTSTTQLLSNIVLYENVTPNFAGNFIVNGILNAGTNQILSSTGAVPGLNNSFTLNSGAGLITANTNGVQNANVGTVSTSLATRTYSSGANYTYNNSSAIQNSGIFTTTTPNLINNLTINNTAGSGTTGVTLQQPIAIAGVLTLTSGHITTTSTNLLTMNAGSSVATANYGLNPKTTSGGSLNSFVNGPMRKIGSTAFLFPIGKVSLGGTNYGHHPCGISAPANPLDTYTAEYIRGSAWSAGATISIAGLSHVSNCEFWNINTTAASPDVDVSLSWNNQSICNMAVYVDDYITTLKVAHSNGTSWDDFGGFSDANSGLLNGSITWGNVTTFSPFSLASTSSATNPLPVKLVNVKAYHTGDRNRIEWTNLTEIDVVAYEVERSLNGTQFTSMASLTARSNTNDKESYYEYDVQPASVTYYRIKVTSRDGEIVYSPIVKVATNLTVKQDIVLYPNPVTGKQFTMQMNSAAGDYYVKIFSANGQIVKTETLKHPGGAYAKTIELPAQLQAGQYYMQVSGGEKILTSKFIVQ